MSAQPSDLKSLGASVGLIQDRTVDSPAILGNVWVIDKQMVATCAHLVTPYRNFLNALKVTFPNSRREWAVESIMLHPKFDLKKSMKMTNVSLTETVPSLAVQTHNAVVLKLTEGLPQVTEEMVIRVNRQLSLPLPPREQGLGGNLGEIDLYLVIQTITNSRKEGIITICDDRNVATARLFCQHGRVMYATYQNLVNEMAIYQIVNKNLRGNFHFWAASKPNWQVAKAISRPADMVLIESHRRFDELKRFVPMVGDTSTLILRTAEEPNYGVLPAEVKDYTKMIWPLLDGGIPVGQLWQLASIDDYAVYSSLYHLLQTNQVMVHTPTPVPTTVGDGGSELIPLEMAVNSELVPWDRITSLSRDFETGTILSRQGSLLGLLRESDPWHMIHNIRLVPGATGSPIFKDRQVIGMHCGPLSADELADQPEGSAQSMLWVDSIIDCLKGGGEKELVNRLTMIDMPISSTERRSKPAPAGCREVARLDCPRCGRTSLDSARFCRSCGQKLLKDMDIPAPPTRPRGRIVPQAKFPTKVIPVLVALVLATGATLYAISPTGPFLSQMNVVDVEKSIVAIAEPAAGPDVLSIQPKKVVASNRVELGIYQAVGKQISWEAQDPNKQFKNDDFIYFRFTINRPGFVYVLYHGTSGKEDSASLIYPMSEVDNKILKKGSTFTIPADVQEKLNDEKATQHVGLKIQPPPGVETLVFIASDVRLNLLGDPKLVNSVYARSQMLLDNSPVQSIEVERAELPEGLISEKSDDAEAYNQIAGTKSDGGKSVFIGKQSIKHNE